MEEQLKLDFESIPARDAEIGGKYLSRTGLTVIVKEKGKDRVIVRSLATGNDVAVALDYRLKPTGGQKQ